MWQDRMQQFVRKHPFTVFILGGGQVSILIGTFCVFLGETLFSSYDQVVTASSTVNDLLYILAQRQVIPTNYQGIYTLCYRCIGSLLGSSTMASLGVGSLSHFHLRMHVCGGAGKSITIFYHTFHLFPSTGHVSGSEGPSPSSRSSTVPISVKKTRVKQKLSDEDVWEWPDAKIIGMHMGLVHL